MTTYTRIFDGVADHATTFKLFNRGHPSPSNKAGNPYAGPVLAGQFFEITGGDYDFLLNSLSPLVMGCGGFVLSEYQSDDLVDAFVEIAGRFFCVTLRVPEGEEEIEQEINALEALRAARAAITQEMAERVFS